MNFVGASRELQTQVKQMNEKLSAVFTNATTKWIFNPPSAPHMGGSWERLVRSVKVAFAGLSITRNPDDETLLTLMTEAEGVINTRPLTFMPLENDSQEALTPNHFLLLSSQGVAQRPEPLVDRAEFLRNSYSFMKGLVDEFWHRWIKEYLPTIAVRTKWIEDSRDLQEGDAVIVVDESTRNGWLRGRVLSVVKGCDGRVRQAYVRTSTGVLRRPASKIAVLEIQSGRGEKDLGNTGQPESSDQYYGSGDVGSTTPLLAETDEKVKRLDSQLVKEQ
ncbi:uncharacterized protein LOC134290714 [Aedes albopictus]|uniref:DUF5641 domain-containing protein n=1 Tax=Aedes albopictus TaxID=7160 RepID=A0ABM1XYF5_AEDAL